MSLKDSNIKETLSDVKKLQERTQTDKHYRAHHMNHAFKRISLVRRSFTFEEAVIHGLGIKLGVILKNELISPRFAACMR